MILCYVGIGNVEKYEIRTMIRKSLGVILLVIVCCFGNVSCQKSSDKMICSIDEFPKTYKRVSDSIKIEVNIVIDETAEAFLYNGKARRIKINEEKIVKDLLYKNNPQKEVEKIDKWLYKNAKGAALTIIKDTAIYMSNSENYKVVQKELEEKFSKKR